MVCTTCYCRIPRCPLFGQVAPRAQFTWHDWHRQAPRWRCRACRALVSARPGTAYAGIRTEGTTSLRGAVALAEGLSIRATGRLLDVDNAINSDNQKRHFSLFFGCQFTSSLFTRRATANVRAGESWN